MSVLYCIDQSKISIYLSVKEVVETVLKEQINQHCQHIGLGQGLVQSWVLGVQHCRDQLDQPESGLTQGHLNNKSEIINVE